MINFKEYLTEEVNKTTDEAVKDTVIHKADSELTLSEVIEKANPSIWTAREVGGSKYLIYNGKFINMSRLKKAMDIFYNNKGYKNYGFSKLSEPELIRYTTVKNILMPFFTSSLDQEIDIDTVVEKLFINEPKEFYWKPEEY